MFLGDYAADLKAMPRTTFEKIMSAVENIEVESYDIPVELDGRLKQKRNIYSFQIGNSNNCLTATWLEH